MQVESLTSLNEFSPQPNRGAPFKAKFAMTNDWDFYSLLVDDKPASIFVDLGIAEQAPVAALPFMAYVRLHMRAHRDDGLSSQQEFDALIKVEDLLTDAVCSEFVGYVGRNTSNGCRDFYFYVSSPDHWSGAVEQALSGSGYEFETGTREDAAWSSYLQFLMPAPRDRERMQNRRVCEALERQGDKLEEHRDIDHWSYFPNESAASAFLVETQSLGYRVRVEPSRVEGWRPSLRSGLPLRSPRLRAD